MIYSKKINKSHYHHIDRNLGMKDPINRVIYVPIFGKLYLKYFPIDLVSVDKKLLLIKK